MSWHFTVEKIEARVGELKKAMVRHRQPLTDWQIIREGAAEPEAGISPGGSYLAQSETVTLRRSITIPAEWNGQRVFLGLELGGAESLVMLDGRAAQAIDLQHHEMLLADPAIGGAAHTIELLAYTGSANAQRSGGWSGAGVAETDGDVVKVVLRTAEMLAVDADTEGLYYDMKVALDAAKTMDVNSREYVTILNVLDGATDLLDFRAGVEDDAFYRSAAQAREHVQSHLYQKYHADPDFAPTLWATGHAHIDTAWLWQLAQTRKKCERTFTTALALMDQYPDYKFSCSQPQQYAYVKEDNPALYERIKAAVADGRWEAVGGMWVESDCNVVSGESLVRQFLYGLRFFQREFGKHTNVVWLPDVFGYSAAFPQIIRKAGMKYFMTIKIFWNQINKPPYQTFGWEGIDGTTVLTHFSPLGDYNAVMTPEQWKRTWDSYKQKSINDSALYIYGYGDGGGGPTRQMLEASTRARDFPGLPKVKLTTNEAFFEDLEAQVSDKKDLPRWVGELYLEYHRGTYTSQARNKRSNRQAEFGLQTAEQISSLAMLLAGTPYAQDRVNKAWEVVLLNQFHDIIPGSSIHEVYLDSDKDYATVRELYGQVTQDALDSIAAKVQEGAGDVVVYNPLSWARADVAEVPRYLNLPGQHVLDMQGAEKTLIQLGSLPALGYDTLQSEALPLLGNAHGDSGLRVTTEALENQFFRITLNADGEIESLFDKSASREVIDKNGPCKGNALLSFEDKPMTYDAWDIDIYYLDKMMPVNALDSITVLEEGPLRASVEIKRTFGRGSTLTQRISIYRDLPRIDFATVIDWQERQTLLKVAFPVNVRSPRATYDIQFGNVERPTHWNTSWDWARFEVCGQKWADLSEGDYGVSLLSDCKYGWDIRDNVMRLTLLKGAISPDPDADIGHQSFTYSLYPHKGDWRAAETVRRAYELNVPVQAARVSGKGDLPGSLSLFSIDAPNLILETIKKAEDDDALIVRLHETYGQRGMASLTAARPIASAVEVNLMEVETDDTRASAITSSGNSMAFSFTPFEIKTFKLYFAAVVQ